MVLKFADVNGWQFIDKVKKLTQTPIDVKEFNNDGGLAVRTFDEIVLYSYNIFQEILIPIGGQSENNIKYINAYLEDGSNFYLLSDLAIYLLSDEGKTIERIN